MGTALVDLPKTQGKNFLNPENRDLVLSLVASGFVLTFWNAINIRPSMLTDPGYQDQKAGITRVMNLSFLVVVGMAAGLSVIYGRSGYIPSVLMVLTGAGMYAWSAAELNHQESGTVLQPEVVLNDAAARATALSVLYTPVALPPKRRREHSSM